MEKTTRLAPQQPHTRVWARCSVTSGRTTGRSITWRRCSPDTGACERSAPQPEQASGTWSTTTSGVSVIVVVVPFDPGCFPARRRLPPAARCWFAWRCSAWRRRSAAGSREGGFDEFPEFFAASALSAATWARSNVFSDSLAARRSDTETTKATSSSWLQVATASADTESLIGHLTAPSAVSPQATRTYARSGGYLNGYHSRPTGG